ncbi:uncharacterized protein MELLADRAFT_68561 [Melampsora larici-populina 98AG31]|uniref:Uncharacterized protein n=1 Tax=Melampsora larici-populina (strain 98AG31 / pathotype 3-4-7) TaxID=747676 RepID=F4S788_MELLP|nr:uncharacterized protein MELLADRAFT_68561 [Melampsora larici-populina 98AG31]EGF99516.1 hypothetical protein MELLADRAFT_68561 [Melampsora larici-populina 98AG31]
MSAKREIDQFDAQVKRSSDRLRNGSASPPEAQTQDGTLDNTSTTHQANPEGDNPTSQGTSSATQGRKRGQGGKKGQGANKNTPPTGTTTRSGAAAQETPEGGPQSKEGTTQPSENQPPSNRDASSNNTDKQPEAERRDRQDASSHEQSESVELGSRQRHKSNLDPSLTGGSRRSDLSSLISPEIVNGNAAREKSCKPCPHPLK